MKCDVFSWIHRYCKNVLTVFIATRNELENDDLENDDLENDDLENDDLEHDDLEHDDLENDDLENDDLENDDLENNDLENDDLENDDLENDDRDGVARRIKGLEGYRRWEIRGRYEGIMKAREVSEERKLQKYSKYYL